MRRVQCAPGGGNGVFRWIFHRQGGTGGKTADTGFHLRDNDALYTVYDDSGVVTMYLTVTRGTEAENTDHTWEQINSYSAYDYEAMQVPRYQVEGLLQVGDESGPAASEVGYGETVPNATVQIRGQTSSRNAQKTTRSS